MSIIRKQQKKKTQRMDLDLRIFRTLSFGHFHRLTKSHTAFANLGRRFGRRPRSGPGPGLWSRHCPGGTLLLVGRWRSRFWNRSGKGSPWW